MITLVSCFYVIDVANGANDGILPKEGTYYNLGLIDGITKKCTLGILLGAYDKLGVHLVDGTDDAISLKQ